MSEQFYPKVEISQRIARDGETNRENIGNASPILMDTLAEKVRYSFAFSATKS